VSSRPQHEQRLTALALSDCSPEAFAEGKVEAIGELQSAQADLERTAAIFDALSGKADELAHAVAVEDADRLRSTVAATEIEHETRAAEMATLTARLRAEEAALARAELAVGRAARYSEATRAAAEALEVQEAEQVLWHSMHDAGHPERWPIHLHVAISAKIAENIAEVAAHRARQADQSRESLAATGLSPDEARDLLGVGNSRGWPRKLVQ